MRIYIKLNTGRRFKIPAPIGLVKVAFGLGGFGVAIARRYIPVKKRQYIDCVDFKELSKSLDLLRDYKGLNMVDIKTEDGTEVKITI